MSDAKFFNGWVAQIREEDVHVRLNGPSDCMAGERFLVEIAGQDRVATFHANLLQFMDGVLHLAMITPIQMRQASEAARVSVSGIAGVLIYDGTEGEIKVLDVSTGGMAILHKNSIPRSEFVKFRLRTPVGEIGGDGQVRYCRLDPSGNGLYRLGVQVLQLQRVEHAKWMRMLGKDAA